MNDTIADITVYANGYRRYEVITTDQLLVERLKGLGFTYWENLGVADIIVKKYDAEKFRKLVDGLNIETRIYWERRGCGR